MKYVRCGAEFVFFCFFFVCPSRYVARHRKPRRCVCVLNLGGTGIGPPDNFSYRSNFRFRFSFRFRSHSRSSSCCTTCGDIFYCSGSRQLNHSSENLYLAVIQFCYGDQLSTITRVRQFPPDLASDLESTHGTALATNSPTHYIYTVLSDARSCIRTYSELFK